MDIDACLADLRALLVEALVAFNEDDAAEALVLLSVFLDKFSALDDWLSIGGFLPAAWSRHQSERNDNGKRN